MKIVITGTLASMQRREAKARITAAGGSMVDRVNGETNYLVKAESPGGNVAKAEELGVEIITEALFLQFLDAGVFPQNQLPGKLGRERVRVDSISWSRVDPSQQRELDIEYVDDDGVISERRIRVLEIGRLERDDGTSYDYYRARDNSSDGAVKTFRLDRMRESRKVEPEEELPSFGM